MQRMKQLACTAVYWPTAGIGTRKSWTLSSHLLSNLCRKHQGKTLKDPVHPWMLPEKPWSRVHIDHAVNFMGHNWLVLIEAYSKYPIIHQTTSTSSKATIQLLEEDFAPFGFPHTIVSDNATSFSSDEFQSWCQEHGITHLAGASYHSATNGAVERLVQSFKKPLRKSSLLPKSALQGFLMMYRRTPLASGLSPSEILNGRQIRSLIDILKPSPVHIAQGRISQTTRAETTSSSSVAKVLHSYKASTPVYVAYYGPRNDKDPRWVPAIVKKPSGARTILVHVCPRGPVWKRHIEQLRPRYGADQDADPGGGYHSKVNNSPTSPESSPFSRSRFDGATTSPDSWTSRANVTMASTDNIRSRQPRRSSPEETQGNSGRRSQLVGDLRSWRGGVMCLFCPYTGAL
ncbi:hypothetical protein RRG08_040278 [Elysia crispata]|uniref:Integrase catalytic domain-containing protein n=1 Tax=Elysia crispata TaxID=231223 RepID=A0AAE1AEE7_9GAST|nr:hypothetical protein RRG08_040278 [Elysia crispata]